MKTLNTIQTLAKIGKILSKIIFIFCIVGFCGCLAGILGLAFGGETFKLGGVTIRGIVEKNAKLNLPTMYAAMAVGMAFCVAEAVVSKLAETYFKHELSEGTPFTQRGAKELMRLGILTIAIPLGTVIVCAICVGVAENLVPGLEKLPIGEYSSVGLGVMMIVLALFCRYGAELRAGNEEAGRMETSNR